MKSSLPVVALNNARRKVTNQRLACVYFFARKDIVMARKAAKKLGLTLTAFLREAALKRTAEVLAA